MSDFSSPKKGSNIICRVANASPENVCNYVRRLPKEIMSESRFRDIMGKQWFNNEHQAPEQWGLYYIDGVNYYPRFHKDISLEEAETYLYGWIKRLIVINPYTRFKTTNDSNLVLSIVKQLEKEPNEHDLKTIISTIIGSPESFVVNEIITNAINNYSEILSIQTIDKDKELYNVYLLPNHKEIIKTKYNMTKKEYFELFDDIMDSKKRSSYHNEIINASVANCPDIIQYLTALRTKPFMLLAGISGTGKSRIVRKLAQATSTQHYANESDRWNDNRPENFELIQVKPNWHNSMDVVGFYSNISKKYEFTPFVEFIVKAWQHTDTPYFLCLDEMNLAPVEEYFAEFLSAIESRSTDSEGNYITDPIIKPFKDFGKNDIGEDIGKNMLKHLFGEADPIDKNPLAVQFYKKGLTLPPNLMVMGTVNMDETTFSFSRKVLDRAMSVEMNEVDYDKFLSGETEAFPLLTDFNALLVNRPQKASEVKDDIESAKVVEYLKDINALLEDSPFKLGYRAANEVMLYVAANKELAGEKFSLTTALDEFTLMKILSRIEGDDQRLSIDENDPRIAAAHITADTDGDPLSLLTCLRAIVRNHLGDDTQTKKKIASMCRTLEREHFVSYWS